MTTVVRPTDTSNASSRCGGSLAPTGISPLMIAARSPAARSRDRRPSASRTSRSTARSRSPSPTARPAPAIDAPLTLMHTDPTAHRIISGHATPQCCLGRQPRTQSARERRARVRQRSSPKGQQTAVCRLQNWRRTVGAGHICRHALVEAPRAPHAQGTACEHSPDRDIVDSRCVTRFGPAGGTHRRGRVGK